MHGIADTGRVWDGTRAALGGAHRAVAPDLPGFGAARAPARPRDLRELRALTDRLVARLDLPARFVLVDHDVGGLFGLAWAVARPERLAALVVLDTSVFADRRRHWGGAPAGAAVGAASGTRARPQGSNGNLSGHGDDGEAACGEREGGDG